MRFDAPMYKRKHKENQWDEVDSAGLHDEKRALFGEEDYLQRYMQMATFKDVLNGQTTAKGSPAVDDMQFASQFPVCYMFMALTVDDDGKPRQPATITIVCEQGMVKVGINERNLGLSLWTASATLGGAFGALEEALTERPVRWRKVDWKGRK